MDALALSDYNEIDFFVKELGKIRERQRIQRKLENVECYRVALLSMQDGKNFKGGNFLKKWNADMIDLLKVENEKETLFSRRKKNKSIKTIFQRRKGNK